MATKSVKHIGTPEYRGIAEIVEGARYSRGDAEPFGEATARPVTNSCVPSVAMIGVSPAKAIKAPFSKRRRDR